MDDLLDVELLRRRDPVMTERFLEALRRIVRLYVRRPIDVESVARDALAELLEKLERGDQPKDIPQWIWTAASNATKRFQRREYQPHVAYDSMVHTQSEAATLSHIQRFREQLQAVGRGLARMPEATQQAVIEVGVEGRTTGSVAAELGVPPGTLRKELSRARQQLQRELTAQEKLDKLRELAREVRRKREAEQGHSSRPPFARSCERSDDSSTASR